MALYGLISFYSNQAHKCNRMVLTIFKMFIWGGISEGGISSDILSKIRFYHSSHVALKLNF